MSFLRETGVIAAAVTPWADDGSVDLNRFDDQIRWIAEQRPLAISVASVEVQEYHLLDSEQRIALVERAVAAAGGIPVIGGVTTPTPRTSVVLSERMAGIGASAVLALAGPKPWAAPQTGDEMVTWFGSLADRSPVPVLCYSNPRTGSEPSVSALADICQHENIGAIKETSRDMVKVLGLCKQIGIAGSAGVYINMETLMATVLLGGQGAMVPAPGLPASLRILDALRDGDLDLARHWQLFFTDFPSRWMRLGLGPAVKAALAAIGVNVGGSPEPYASLTTEEQDEIRALFQQWELVR
jgi:4-hydroxy-tetrahydrodipicolinate synthase